ncbi:Breast cancer anti-estrogen resistance protein 1 [Bienertia sinuspersici]
MSEKPIMLVGIDEGEHSFYALTWTLDHFFTPFAPNFPYKLHLVHNKPTLSSAIGVLCPDSREFYQNVKQFDKL